MPRVGFEPTIPVLQLRKTVHALDRAATVIGYFFVVQYQNDLSSCPMITAAELLRKMEYRRRMSGPSFGLLEVSAPHPAIRHDGHNPLVVLNIPGQQKIILIFLSYLHFA
jgi:hypothetical protein